jgi:UDP-glucose 4-epimerase
MTLKNKKIFVTGGTGMIGANLVRRLIADGCDISVFTRREINFISNLEAIKDSFRVLQGDITDQESIKAAIDTTQPDIVFHLACTPFNLPDITSQHHLQVNVAGTLNLLEALRQSPHTKIIFTGSTAAYGSGSQLRETHPMEPGTMLGATKACASILLQTYAKLHNMNTLELRLFAPYGPWEHSVRMVPHVILSALNGQDVPMTLGRQQRDFVYIDDVIEALILGVNSPLAGGTVLNIGSGTGTPIVEVAEGILALMGNPVKLLVGAIQTRPDEIMEMSADISITKETLGWAPQISLDEGLTKSIDWFTQHREPAGVSRP